MSWPYPTSDEESHLAVLDAGMLHARIDMLIEERRALKTELRFTEAAVPHAWALSPAEERFAMALLERRGWVSNERLHVAIAGEDEPDTNEQLTRVYACKLRKKLRAHLPEGADPIISHWGRGYEASDALRAAAAS